MRSLMFLALFAAHAASAGPVVVHVSAETMAAVDADDFSIPLRRCFASSDAGLAVADGAERCASEFALPLSAGQRLLWVRALYEDDDFTPGFELSVVVRNAMSGGNTLLAHDQDPGVPTLTALNQLTLEPKYLLPSREAPFVRAEVRGDTRLLVLSYAYE